MKIKKFFLPVLISCCMACNYSKDHWKTIEVGQYLLNVPQDFNFKPIQGIDSQGGLISNGRMKLYTGFGYFTDTLTSTPQEYLDMRWFIGEAATQFMKPGIIYDKRNQPKIELISIRPSTRRDSDKYHFFGGADYIAICKHDGKVFNWPIKLPPDVKHHAVQIDTFNNLYRRVAIPQKGYNGETGVYMRARKDFNPSRNSYYAIVIGKDSLSEQQQALALKIFKTLRPKE